LHRGLLTRPGEGESAGGSAEAVIGGGIKPIFELPIGPITGWDIADLDGNGQDEIIVSTHYGAVLVLGEHGQTMTRCIAGIEASDVSVLYSSEGTAYLLVAAGNELLLYTADLEPVCTHSLGKRRCAELQRFASQGGSRVMCLLDDGSAWTFACLP